MWIKLALYGGLASGLALLVVCGCCCFFYLRNRRVANYVGRETWAQMNQARRERRRRDEEAWVQYHRMLEEGDGEGEVFFYAEGPPEDQENIENEARVGVIGQDEPVAAVVVADAVLDDAGVEEEEEDGGDNGVEGDASGTDGGEGGGDGGTGAGGDGVGEGSDVAPRGEGDMEREFNIMYLNHVLC